MKSSLKIARTVVLLIILVISGEINATNSSLQQTPTPGPLPPPPGYSDNDSVPIDGGLAALLLGATFFGVKKLRNRKQ
ncbi:PID-CTERM protein-sorting domain-containing protein [Neotamlana laminarinivorans]|uniref:Uncharacterized protein n=1 Tax=Neotamlana laminarinivorans TaxID=2883124 RepID=A0A9X1L1B5_9FLAO|nr:hypothetical protein [Tamlana laminarinivorans]MCB4798568.1 hypothetical protein [Tamlana laminarinivorans]